MENNRKTMVWVYSIGAIASLFCMPIGVLTLPGALVGLYKSLTDD